MNEAHQIGSGRRNARRRKVRKSAAWIAIGAIGVLGAAAQGAPHERGNQASFAHASYGQTTYAHVSSGRDSYAHISYDHGRAHAGTLVIDGRCFTIRSGRSVIHQVRRAFRRCGYSTRYHRDRLAVYDRRGCAPRVQWRSGRYGAEFSRYRGKLVMCWYKVRDRHHYWRSGHRFERPQRSWSRGGRRGWTCD